MQLRISENTLDDIPIGLSQENLEIFSLDFEEKLSA